MEKNKLALATNLVLAMLVAYLAFLILGSMESGAEKGGPPFPDRRSLIIDMERSSLESYLGHYPPGSGDREKLVSFIEENPDSSAAFLSLGDIYYDERNLSLAATSYRRAVEINRRYCDSGDPFYHGGKLNDLVQDGLKVYKRERAMRPGDKKVRQTVKDLYFLERTLAGGCD